MWFVSLYISKGYWLSFIYLFSYLFTYLFTYLFIFIFVIHDYCLYILFFLVFQLVLEVYDDALLFLWLKWLWNILINSFLCFSRTRTGSISNWFTGVKYYSQTKWRNHVNEPQKSDARIDTAKSPHAMKAKDKHRSINQTINQTISYRIIL